MTNKKILLGMLVMALVFGITVIGCDNGTNGNGNDDDNEISPYTVTFDLDGGNMSGNTTPVQRTVNPGETIANLPNPTKANNTFGGWFSQKNGAGNQFTTATEVTLNLTVYAKWTTANTDPKNITITGLTGKSGSVEIILGDMVNNNDVLIAKGQGTISNNSVTVLLKNNNSNWTGTGSYMIQLKFVSIESYWFYTNGKTWTELGIANASEEEVFRKLPKYDITNAASTITFDKFKEQP